MHADAIIVTWDDMDGLEPTGRTIVRDGIQRAEWQACLKVRAVVWSRDMGDRETAEIYAKSVHNGTVHVLKDDHRNLLETARKLHLQRLREHISSITKPATGHAVASFAERSNGLSVT